MASNRSTCNPIVSHVVNLLSATLLGVLLMFGPGCGQDAPSAGGNAHGGPPQADHGPGARGGHPGGKPDQQAIPVAVSRAWIGPIASYYNSTATLESEREAQVLARVTGVVQELVAEEGDEIAAEGALLIIANDEYRLRVLQAEAKTANLRARFDRFKAMLDEQLTTEEEFQAAKSELATAEADEGLARLNFSYTTVKAPFTGLVTQRLVDVGQNVSMGDALFVVADFHPLLARVHVPSREFNQLQPDQNVNLILDSDGSRLQGTIKLVSPVIDAASGTIKITVQVDDYPAGTRPGDFAEVLIVTESRPEAVLVQRSAVLTDKGERIVYVSLAADKSDKSGAKGAIMATAERRVVEIGFTDDEHAQILAGLEAGDQVVVKGQRSLKHGSVLKILETVEPGAGS